MRIRLLFFVLSLFFFINPVLASDPPTLISPANNSTITSIPTFSWQAISGGVEYNILIDDEPTVSNPYVRTYYPTNPSYSPQSLDPGTYYWKVKAKDGSGWSNTFSSIWSFTLVNSSSSPAPIPTPSSSQAILFSSPTSSPSSSFIISNIPSQISSNQSFTVFVNLSLPNNPNTSFFLKGAFIKSGSSNYFGLTKVLGNWVKNGSSYSNQYSITTDSSGNWSGNLEVQPDPSDSGYTGTDDYVLKVGRYSSSGLGPTWSNGSSIRVTGDSTNSDISSTTTKSTATSFVNPSSKSVVASSSPKFNYQIASVAGIISSATPSAIAEVKASRQINFLPWIGGVLVICGISPLIYVYLRARNG